MKLKLLFAAAVVLLSLPMATHAQITPSSNNPIYYPYHNKWAAFDASQRAFKVKSGHAFLKHEHLLNDLIVAGSFGADAGSSINDQIENPGAIETNPFLSKHPSPEALVGFSAVEAAAVISIDHLIWHLAKNSGEPESSHLTWVGTAAISIGQVFNVKSNVDVAERQNVRIVLTPSVQ